MQRSARRTTLVRRAGRPAGHRSARVRPRPCVGAILVTVPARNEAGTIGRCLLSLDRAAACVPGVDVLVVVAADTCHDDTVARAQAATLRHARGPVVVEGTWRGAGAARAAAVACGLELIGASPSAVWLTSTDADCSVDDDWLVAQLAHAGAGHDAVAGIVRLDESAPARLRGEFAAAYAVAGAHHRHVHAANLGVRADAYADAGGWYVHAVVGEEHRLWRNLVGRGWRVTQPTDVVVTTSARTHGRVVGGFASALARLDRHPTERSA